MGASQSAGRKPIMSSPSAETNTDQQPSRTPVELKMDEKGVPSSEDTEEPELGLMAKHQKQKADEEVQERSPNQELRFWVSQGDVEKVKELAKQDADVNAADNGPEIKEDPKKKKKKKKEEDDKPKDAPKITGDYPLHIAAERGDVAMIEALFYLQARMDCKNRIGSTPLHRAVSSGKREAVTTLLKLGADLRATNLLGNTVLHIATIVGDIEMMQLLTTLLEKKDARVQNKVFLTAIEYTLLNSPERQVLLEWDPTLADLLRDGASREAGDDEEDEKE